MRKTYGLRCLADLLIVYNNLNERVREIKRNYNKTEAEYLIRSSINTELSKRFSGIVTYDNLGKFAREIMYKANSEVNGILRNWKAMAELEMMLGYKCGRGEVVKFILERIYRAKIPENLREGTGTPLDAILNAVGYVGNWSHLVYEDEDSRRSKGGFFSVLGF